LPPRVLLLVMGATVGLQRWVGLVFLLGLASYLVYAFRQERTAGAGAGDHTAAFGKAEVVGVADPALRPRTVERGSGVAALVAPLVIALAGLATIIFGGRFLVDGAVDLALTVGLSEAIVGLTIVAVGTSTPELVTSLVAAVRRQTDMAFGNILGSCLYNSLGIGGFTALIAPMRLPEEIVRFDLPVMLAASALLVLFAWTGRRISRGEGAAFVGLYIVYLTYLIGS
jgi:cation:H+ antiporter